MRNIWKHVSVLTSALFRLFLFCGLITVYVGCKGNAELNKKEYGLGKIEFAKGNLEGAYKHFHAVEKNDSSYADVPLYLAKLAYYKGDFAKASELFGEFLSNKEYGFQATILKFKSDYVLKKDPRKLLLEIGEFLRRDSSNMDLLLLSAKIQEDLGQVAEAILNYERVLNETDKLVIAHGGLKNIYEKAGLPDRAAYHARLLGIWNQDSKTNEIKKGKK